MKIVRSFVSSLLLVAAFPTTSIADGDPAARCQPDARAEIERARAARRDHGDDGADEAIIHASQAAKLDPRCASAPWELGSAARAKGDLDAAREAWDQVKKLDPAYPTVDASYLALEKQRNARAKLSALPGSSGERKIDTAPSEGASITIAAVGDVTFGRAWPPEQRGLPPDDGRGFLSAAAPLIEGADIRFGNLETVLADDGQSTKCGKASAAAGKCYAFRAPAIFGQELVRAGFNVMSIANNHAGDFGPEGREHTMATLDAVKIQHSGPIGDLALLEVRGKKIGLIAFSFGGDNYRIQDLDLARRAIADLAQRTDLTIVSFHGGAEGINASHVPPGVEIFLGEDRGDERAFAHLAIDAGAAIVLGHGPHLLRGMERYRGRLIAYSLGNFSGWQNLSLAGALSVTAVLRVELAPNGVLRSAELRPVKIEKPGHPAPDPDRKAIERVRTLSQEDFGAPLFDPDGKFHI